MVCVLEPRSRSFPCELAVAVGAMGDDIGNEVAGPRAKGWLSRSSCPHGSEGVLLMGLSYPFPGCKGRVVADALDQPQCAVPPGRNRRFPQGAQTAASAGPKLVRGLPLGSEDEGVQRLDSSPP